MWLTLRLPGPCAPPASPGLGLSTAPSRRVRGLAGPGGAAAQEQAQEGGTGGAGACLGCGRKDLLGGCNGEGRIMGGIGAVPGFGWWPIKAYRPCPAFLEAGGKYKRKGQSLDEVAFGRRSPDDDLLISERLEKLGSSDVQTRLQQLKQEEDNS